MARTTYLTVRYDVTDLTEAERAVLAGEAQAQADRSRSEGEPGEEDYSPGHPGVDVTAEVVEVVGHVRSQEKEKTVVLRESESDLLIVCRDPDRDEVVVDVTVEWVAVGGRLQIHVEGHGGWEPDVELGGNLDVKVVR